MTTFQRARSAEQREVRRRAILDTAAAMLTELPVADLSLNELSRRVGLAKSNVLKYFESREAVLLELWGIEFESWVEDVRTALRDVTGSPAERGEQLVDAVVRTLSARPVFCDLISAQASVLERNISTGVALTFKRAALRGFEGLLTVVVEAVPQIGVDGASRFIANASMLAGAIWTHSHPTPAILAAYDADPALAAIRQEFEPALREALTTLLHGVLPR
ncbi:MULTISPECIES: TetR/AcrR family transcriptional regulator [unclassified Kribbella]|uniref:TetR/AcrR family transcriptional regulator n=1 Tax=unclassified Kribbella TaxID=2644121 RepID=UPI003018DC3F